MIKPCLLGQNPMEGEEASARRMLASYGIALNDLERPAITWV